MYRKPSESWLKHWDFILWDLFFLQIAFVLSFLVRNGLRNPYKIQSYLNMGIVICLLDICAVFLGEGYSGIMRRGYLQEFKAVIKHVGAIGLLGVAYLFLSKNGEEISRIFFVLFIISAVLLLYVERSVWKQYLLRCRKASYKGKALLLLAAEDTVEEVLEKFEQNIYNELKIVGIVLLDRDDRKGEKIRNIQIVCNKDELLEYVRTEWVDGVFINTGGKPAVDEHIKNTLINMGIAVHIVVAPMAKKEENQLLENMCGFVVLSGVIRAAAARDILLKRIIDIAGGIIGLILTALFAIFVGPAIYISSPGPIFFSQIRVGKNGRKFKIYKFRSMYLDAEQRKKELEDRNVMKGLMFKMDADPRIIGSGVDGKKHGIGWFIRKTSIDEFPQFWNILKGDMSLVGTRPPTVDEWEQYEYHHRARMAIKPGLTGLWQVSGRNEITDFEEIVRMDLDYIQNWSLELDIKILFKTILVVLQGQGAK